jgi:5,10-methylenetetrahydromethanopterin reductase
MAGNDRSPVGLAITSETPPEDVPGIARLGEELGFGEIWLPEDYFFSGGISTAAAVLAATPSLPVGLGIVSALVRHPGLLAMELATISRMYPGRLHPGIGLGVPYWLGQMGLMPKSSLGAMRECVTSLRRLLAGEELTESGNQFFFENVKLTHPATESLPLYMGVVGPKMLRLSGEIADGTVLGVTASLEYVHWARGEIATGAERAGNTGKHRVVCYGIFAVDKDRRKARATARGQVAFYCGVVGVTSYSDAYGISDELRAMIAEHGIDGLHDVVPEQWVEDLSISGDPEECVEKIRRYLEAGVDSVMLWLPPGDEAEARMRMAATEILPRI